MFWVLKYFAIIGEYNAKIPLAGTAIEETKLTAILKLPLSSIVKKRGIIIESILKAKIVPMLPANAYKLKLKYLFWNTETQSHGDTKKKKHISSVPLCLRVSVFQNFF